MCTYARIATVEMQIPTDLLDFWREPASFFIMSGALPWSPFVGSCRTPSCRLIQLCVSLLQAEGCTNDLLWSVHYDQSTDSFFPSCIASWF